MISQNAPISRESITQTGRPAAIDPARRSALVAEMVTGAILPRLLARKDDGAFERGANVVRFPHGAEA